jgi:hypothetical protein
MQARSDASVTPQRQLCLLVMESCEELAAELELSTLGPTELLAELADSQARRQQGWLVQEISHLKKKLDCHD